MIKVSAGRRIHILDGDATGGGHGPGRKISGKSEFPATLSDNDIIDGIETIANGPASYASGAVPSAGAPIMMVGKIKGVDTVVIVYPDLQDVKTAYPQGVPRNP